MKHKPQGQLLFLDHIGSRCPDCGEPIRYYAGLATVVLGEPVAYQYCGCGNRMVRAGASA